MQQIKRRLKRNRQIPPSLEYCKIPLSDLNWAYNLKPTEWKLFIACWISDRFGSRFQVLGGFDWKSRSFHQARKKIESQGFFQFRKVLDYADNKSTAYWEVKNLKGCRIKKRPPSEENPVEDAEFFSADDGNFAAEDGENFPDTDADFPVTDTKMSNMTAETTEQQGSQDASLSPHNPLTISSKEIVREVGKEKPASGGRASFAEEIEENTKGQSGDSGLTGNGLNFVDPNVDLGCVSDRVSIPGEGIDISNIQDSSQKSISVAEPSEKIDETWNQNDLASRKQLEVEFQAQKNTPEYQDAKSKASEKIHQLLLAKQQQFKSARSSLYGFFNQNCKSKSAVDWQAKSNQNNQDLEAECSSYSEYLNGDEYLEEEIW